MNWSNRKTVVAAVLFLLLSCATTALVTYQLTTNRNAEAAMGASSPGERDIIVQTDLEGPETFDRNISVRGGTLRIVTADGRVVRTNGVDTLTFVDGSGTNSLTITPADRGARRVMRYRVRTSPGSPGGGAGVGTPEEPVP